MYIFFSVTITKEGGIRTRVTDGTLTARITTLLGNLGPDLLNLIEFAA